MARHPTGQEALQQARHDLLTAETVDQLRVAQAVVFPLDLEISLTRTAELIGTTPGWVARARVRYIKRYASGERVEARGGRRNNLLSLDEERQFVKAALGQSRYSLNSVMKNLKIALEKRLDRDVATSTVYKIFYRVTKSKGKQPMAWKQGHNYVDF